MQPSLVPSKPSTSSGTTTSPDSPSAPTWMCDWSTGPMSSDDSSQHAVPSATSMTIVALPDPSGLPGLSPSVTPARSAVKVISAAWTTPASVSEATRPSVTASGRDTRGRLRMKGSPVRGDRCRRFVIGYTWPLRLWTRRVVGDVGHDRVAACEEPQLQAQRRLVVQQVLPPVARHELGEDHQDGPIRCLPLESVHVRQQRADERAVR